MSKLDDLLKKFGEAATPEERAALLLEITLERVEEEKDAPSSTSD